MNGIIVVNKEINYTSRDVVNIIGKKFNTKKVGHTGTLDPLATGALIICLGNALKISELITCYDKEYLATIKLGIETDTLDKEGKVLKEEIVPYISDLEIKEALNSFIGKINQEVPKYSAVKVKGKKLYEYARNNIEVELPIKEIKIFKLELVKRINNSEFIIKCHVSKGTYIRSLVRDIGLKLNTVATMTELTRTKQGNFSLEEAYTINDINNDNYKVLSVLDILPNIERTIVDDDLLSKIMNGSVLDKFFKTDMSFVLDKKNNLISLYKVLDSDKNKVKPWKMFKSC